MSSEANLIDRLRQAQQNDPDTLGDILQEYRVDLRRMIQLRMDRRLQGRVDPSDVIQEAYIEVTQRLAEYLGDPKMPFKLWLRFLTTQKLMQTARSHLEVKGRDVNREISIYRGMPMATSAVLAQQLAGQITSPSENAIKDELRMRLQNTLDQMETIDREIIALRHFEHLTLKECALILEISYTSACNRYVRALERLKKRFGNLSIQR